MIVVVTGGCGFVGLNLVRRLARAGGIEVRIVDNLSTGSQGNLEAVLAEDEAVTVRQDGNAGWVTESAEGSGRIALHVADVRDAGLARGICEGADAVVNLAAQTGVQISLEHPEADITQNVLGAFHYLEACRHAGVKRFIQASSAAAAGDAPPPQREDAPYRPISPYGAGKSAAEAYCSAYWKSFGVETLPLRFANLYGPFAWQKGSVVAAFCKRGLSGQALIVEGDGRQTRDFVFAGDLVEVILGALTVSSEAADGLFGQPLNVATGVQTRICDLADAVRAQMQHAGRDIAITQGPAREGDVRISAPDTTRLRHFFQDVAMRPLEDGLPQTIEWFLGSWAPIDA